MVAEVLSYRYLTSETAARGALASGTWARETKEVRSDGLRQPQASAWTAKGYC